MTTGTHEKKQADNQTNKKRAETWPGGTVVDARVALEARQTQHAHLRSSAGRRALLAAPRDRLEQLLNLLGTADKLILPKAQGRVADELDKRHQQAPGVRAADNEALEQRARNLLLDHGRPM